MESFGRRLTALGKQRGRLCVGIDPHDSLLEAWGLDTDIAGLRKFSQICAEAFGHAVALVKPQVAFYERYGSQGFAVLEELITSLRDCGCLVLADAKRGDIGSTMSGYAEAWLGDSSPLCCDAVTVHPYLGVKALQPAIDQALATGRGLFILAATSNPEASGLQADNYHRDGRSVSQYVIDEIAALEPKQRDTEDSLGSLGIVVGATVDKQLDLSRFAGPVLLPGVGAQGGTMEEVKRLVGGKLSIAYPNVSRAILKAGPRVDALQNAVAEYRAALG